MKKITGFLMMCFMFVMVGCTNLDDMLTGISDTLTALTGNVHKTINLKAPNVNGVSFQDYRLEVSSETSGNQTYIVMEIKGYVTNNRSETIDVEVQIPIYNEQGRITDVKKTHFFIGDNSREFLNGRWSEPVPPALQVNEKGAITTIYERGHFLGTSESRKAPVKPAKAVSKPAPKKQTRINAAPVAKSAPVETKVEPVKQVRQQRRTR